MESRHPSDNAIIKNVKIFTKFQYYLKLFWRESQASLGLFHGVKYGKY